MLKIYFHNNATLVVMNKLRGHKMLELFGGELKSLRTSNGFTIEKLAFDADIELNQVHRVVKVNIHPTLTTLIALSKGFGLTLAELVG